MWQAGDTANDTLSCEVDEGTLPSRIQVDVKAVQKLDKGSKQV